MIHRLKPFLFLCLVVPLFWAGVSFAATLHFPALTGRVIDDAHLLSAQTVSNLTLQLSEYEQASTNQVVVVTLPSLQGTTIEDFGYQLGRKWGIGQKGKDNGALLIVAPNDRKVRIEVGYGLEGKLTDAVSSQIVYGIILPAFRAGHMEQGIIDGTQGILDVLNGAPVPMPVQQYHSQSSQNDIGGEIALILFASFFVLHTVVLIMQYRRGVPYNSGDSWFFLLFGSGNGSLFSGGGAGGSGFGGFSGGGGSFGGGGASGSW